MLSLYDMLMGIFSLAFNQIWLVYMENIKETQDTS